MTLTKEQQRKVEENMGLVYRVIHDKVHDPVRSGIFTREDLVQIGCIGLCKAAATDRGGTFSTYAYRLIWNEICDALVYASRRQAKEVSYDILPEYHGNAEDMNGFSNVRMDLLQVIQKAEKEVPSSTAKGIRAMCLMAQGYTSKEIGEKMGASDRLVCAWVSKARKYLRQRLEAIV